MKKLYFFTTQACHLCEQAEERFAPVLERRAVSTELVRIDIAGDDQLISRYGERIPVLRREGWLKELSWPFTTEEVEQYLGSD